MDKYILYFEEINKSSLPFVGGKGANLGEMTKAGFTIPKGFCITTLSYKNFIFKNDHINNFFDLLEKVKYNNLKEISVLGKKIRSYIESIKIPKDIENSILNAFEKLGSEKSYAVRSSATAEDLPNASFAGQQDTYLNIKGKSQLLESVKKCWASLFTDRAISYRCKNGFDHKSIFLSVVVQEMISPEVSGIMFTADPITGNRNIISIDASFGLGEALVSGIVSPDLYKIKNNKIIQKKISEKKVAIYPNESGGTITENIPEEKQKIQALENKLILSLSNLGEKIQNHYSSPQDIEWCLYNNNFYIVQSRPITSLYPVPKVNDNKLHIFSSFGHKQMMTDVLSPLSISIWRRIIPFGKPNSSIFAENPFLIESGGRLFIDLTTLLQSKKIQKLLPKLLENIDEFMSNALREVIKKQQFKQEKNLHINKKFISHMLPIINNIQKNLFIKDPFKAIYKANDIMISSVKKSDKYINEVTGSRRIKRIEKNCGTIFFPIFTEIATYAFSGIISMNLIKRLIGNSSESKNILRILNKSLPGNVTTEIGLKIGDLADIVRNNPKLIAYLKNAKDKDFYEGLKAVDTDGLFTIKFDRFMKKYGMRCPGEIDISNTRWEDAPTLIVSSILNQVKTLKPGEHREKFKLGIIEAEKTAKNVVYKLSKNSCNNIKSKLLSRFIKVFRNTSGLRELPKYTIMQHFEIYRKAILEEAEILVNKNIIKEKHQIYYLSLTEILALVNGKFSGNVQKTISSRINKYNYYKKLTPPRIITSEGEIIEGKKTNFNAPKGSLIGTPVSAGIIEGYAKIVLKPENANLKTGEILIAPFTDPGWTPLFSMAKGLVMEVGGLMTHGAVVAREYGIPSVVGIKNATKIIKNGDYIKVNGTEGYVEILKKLDKNL